MNKDLETMKSMLSRAGVTFTAAETEDGTELNIETETHYGVTLVFDKSDRLRTVESCE